MSFLQPALLWALPVIALPIIIHLINQRRFQTIRWGAMMFLLAANRMSRGYARLRRWLILAVRTLAILGLIVAVSRPLASGWRGLVGGAKPDVTLVLVDRSPSMMQRGAGGVGKLESGLAQLTHSFELLGSNRWVLFDSAAEGPLEFQGAEELSAIPRTRPVSASADLPALLQQAFDYVQANRPSRTEIWICSDLRQNDWDADSGRWAVLRDAFLASPHPVRFHLLAYPEPPTANRSIRVTDVRRIETAAGVELLASLKITQHPPAEGEVKLPVELEIDGARSQLTATISGSEVEIKDHSIPLDAGQQRGWGRVSLPADANPSDNEFYFVYDQPAPRRTVIVAEDGDIIEPLQLAASISPEPGIVCEATTVRPTDLISVDWESTALLIWQAPLPEPDARPEVERFVARGGRVLFLPPEIPSLEEFAGVRWDQWEDLTTDAPISTWVGDQDLLANTRSGTALPVGELKVSRVCRTAGEATPLATLTGGQPLLSRAVTDQRNVYFCGTTAAPGDSSLARDGVVLYIAVQRALAAGAASLGTTRQYIAGEAPTANVVSWKPLSDVGEALSDSFALQAGVFDDRGRLLAINRSEPEDGLAVVPDPRVDALFDRLDFDRVDDQAGSGASLLEEIWRLFLALMMAALLAEAGLCLPKPGAASPAAGRGFSSASSGDGRTSTTAGAPA